jgi:heme/copper-type cytochrome/quinol oxidase subunit 2
MIKGWMREITLAVQARSGVTVGLFVALGVAVLAGLTAFAFLTVAGYDWFAIQFGSVFAALLMAGIFLLIAVIAALSAIAARSSAKQRAILERAAHAHAGSWLLDPKIIGAAVQVGRSLGWQRLLPVALLGFMAAQWAREYRQEQSRERSQAPDRDGAG